MPKPKQPRTAVPSTIVLTQEGLDEWGEKFAAYVSEGVAERDQANARWERGKAVVALAAAAGMAAVACTFGGLLWEAAHRPQAGLEQSPPDFYSPSPEAPSSLPAHS